MVGNEELSCGEEMIGDDRYRVLDPLGAVCHEMACPLSAGSSVSCEWQGLCGGPAAPARKTNRQLFIAFNHPANSLWPLNTSVFQCLVQGSLY